MLMEW